MKCGLTKFACATAKPSVSYTYGNERSQSRSSPPARGDAVQYPPARIRSCRPCRANRQQRRRGCPSQWESPASVEFLLLPQDRDRTPPRLRRRPLSPHRTVPHPPAPSQAPPDLHGCRILLRISNFYVPSALFQDNFVSLLNNSFMGSLEVFVQCRPDRRLCSSRAR